MPRSRILREFLSAPLLLAATLGLLLYALGSNSQDKSLHAALVAKLSDVAATLNLQNVLQLPPPQLAARLRAAADATGLRFTVLDGLGIVIADSTADPRLEASREQDPILLAASKTGMGTAERVSRSGQPILVVMVAIDPHPDSSSDRQPSTNDSQASARRQPPKTNNAGFLRRSNANAAGFILVEGSLEPLVAARREWRNTVLLTLSLAVLASVAAALLAVRRWMPPLEACVAAARQLAIGKLDCRLPSISQNHPLSGLRSALSDMSRQLSQRWTELEFEREIFREQARRLEVILAGMGEGVLSVDLEERVLFANAATAILLDLPGPVIPGRPLLETFRFPAIHQVIEDAITRFEPVTLEIELPRSNTALAIRAARLPGQPCPGIVLVLHDVTELRRLEGMRRDFVSNVSHELKTPLASIQAFTETLLDGAIDDPRVNLTFLQRIAEQAERLNHLILDLLRLARIEAGRDVFDIQRLSAAKIIEPCVESHAAIARIRSIRLVSEPSPEPLRIHADAEGLRTIIDNLLDNAVNYTPPGGLVRVAWRRQGEMAVIEVTDTGIGIPEAHLTRIFERFHRVDAARSRERGGTGLGLAIVKHLIQVFNGRVEVESRPQQGSTFRLFLPLT